MQQQTFRLSYHYYFSIRLHSFTVGFLLTIVSVAKSTYYFYLKLVNLLGRKYNNFGQINEITAKCITSQATNFDLYGEKLSGSYKLAPTETGLDFNSSKLYRHIFEMRSI
ncbi:hypothetical protein BV372_24270 [Nostoc sp. T09]|nr:hypothetical protein BV372_24270 [Nostoc sp. T09]